MNYKELIKMGLLGYQPIFFPNGVISGTGLQFFGNLRSMRASGQEGFAQKTQERKSPSFKAKDSFNFNRGRLGNLYVPPQYGARSEFDSEFYYCVDEEDAEAFAKYNLVLLNMYKYFVAQSGEIAASQQVDIESMIEVGCNTSLFPLAFAEAGVGECHGADIVDYSPVVDLLSELKGSNVHFHHMADDSEATWKSLPKVDLVWSYAVVLHQSNPLAHLTRLASLARKAIFVMTISDPSDWKSEKDMGIRYLSANSYYNADFPNCFDVTIVSPELIKYSLGRLGFSKIYEIPHPQFTTLDETVQDDLRYWMNKHCFYLAFRDEPLDADKLNDYSIATERNPYKGENVLVHGGYHHNVVLSNSRYFIVAHGQPFDSSRNDYKSFSNLGNALDHLNRLPDEMKPYPLLISSLRKHNLIRFKNRYFLCPHGTAIDFNNPIDLDNLSTMDTHEKWEKLLTTIGESGLAKLDVVIVDFIDGWCIGKISDGRFRAFPVERMAQADVGILSNSLNELIRRVSTSRLLESMNESEANDMILYRGPDGRILKRIANSGFQIQEQATGALLSKHEDLEGAWERILA